MAPLQHIAFIFVAALSLAPAPSAQGQEQDLIRGSVVPDVMAFSEEDDGLQKVYRYKNAGGRMVYTNVVDQVPPEQFEGSQMDLSHVPLNTELGNEIERRLGEEHDRLVGSSYCKSLEEKVDSGGWKRFWDGYAPLIICGALLLLFVLFTPRALRNMSAPDWARTLTMAIPMLAFAGLMAFTMTRTNRAISELKQQVAPCRKSTWAALKADESPIAQHAKLLENLRAQIEEATDVRGVTRKPNR